MPLSRQPAARGEAAGDARTRSNLTASPAGTADSAVEARFLVSVFAELTGERPVPLSRQEVQAEESPPALPDRLNANRLK